MQTRQPVSAKTGCADSSIRITPHLQRRFTALITVGLIVLLGAALRLHALTRDVRFHPDEALFSAFARSAALNGAWLFPGALDKPPLSLYTMALSMTAFATQERTILALDTRLGEFAARLPAALASITLIAVTYALANRLYSPPSPLSAFSEGAGERGRGFRGEGIVAALCLTLSPYAIAFSAIAFTDGLMLLCMVVALWQIAAGRWSASGVWLALGFACKQQALFYLPLVIALGWGLHPVGTWRAVSLQAIRLFVPIVLCVGALLIWDAARAQPDSMFALAAANNAPWRLIRADEILPRLAVWLSHGGALLGAAPLTGALVALALVAVTVRIIRHPRRRKTLVDVILLTYILGYGLLHWLTAFNTYDRYLLPLLPLVCLLVARGVVGVSQILQFNRKLAVSLCLCAFVLMLLPARDASEGRANVGGDRGEHDDIDQVADFLNSLPLGAIIYDHWLGWELRYYLGEWTDKRCVYYPTPEALAADALRQPDPAPRYFPVPANQPAQPWLDALRAAGFKVTRVYTTRRFVVYELIPRWSRIDV